MLLAGDRRGVLLVAFVVTLAACGAGEPVGPSGNIPPVAPPSGEFHDVSADACGDTTKQAPIETAFVGVVDSVTEGDTPWVSFSVERWFTKDLGVAFSMWAPQFAGESGERWLVAGALYFVAGAQSGEAFSCESEPFSTELEAEWLEAYGGSVEAGSGIPESPPDPALLAEIAAARERWDQAGIDSYTAVVSVFDGRASGDACGQDAAVRMVVEDGLIAQAVDLRRSCLVEDPASLPLIDDLFDMVEGAAGAAETPVDFDDAYGFVRSFFASDRSVELAVSVDQFLPEPVFAVYGTDDVVSAIGTARDRWETFDVSDYRMTLDISCFCTLFGRFEVEVAGGVPVSVVSAEGPVDPTAPGFEFFTFTVGGLFDLIDDWSGGRPDMAIAGFHPNLGYPTDLRIDAIANAIDDEITVVVSQFQPG